MTTEKKLFELLRSEICGQNLPEDLDLTGKLENLYNLSKAHDIAHLVGRALDKNKLLLKDSPIADKFQKQVVLAVYRYERIESELSAISEIFEEGKIPFIPLKGAVIRKLYPEPWMRTSCDIDVFIKKSDLERLDELLKGKGYKKEGSGSHHDVYIGRSGIHVEVHFDLIEKDVNEKSAELLQSVWNYAFSKPDRMRYEMTDKMLYFYHVAHMAKHFIYGGCGIRPFIDLWVLNNLVRLSDKDKANRDELLEKGGMKDFERAAVRLSKVWFEGEAHDELTLQMQRYVLRGGVYGNTKNHAAVMQEKKGGKLRYLLSRIFMPYSLLVYKYPVLKKHKYLLPIMEVRRWLSLPFNGRMKRAKNELGDIISVSSESREQTADMVKKLGL